jgi:hypothetical protein
MGLDLGFDNRKGYRQKDYRQKDYRLLTHNIFSDIFSALLFTFTQTNREVHPDAKCGKSGC